MADSAGGRTARTRDATERSHRDTAPSTPGRGAQESRRAAFTALLEEHEAALLRAARRLCGGNEDEAQDLTQDAAIKAYSAYLAGKFEEGTNARAWLLRILTNGFINVYNHKQRWEDPGGIDAIIREGAAIPDTLRASNADQPEAALLASTLDEPLERAVASLSPEIRVCIEMVDIHEMDYAEAAESLRVPIGTIRSRLFRGRQQLHRALYRYAKEHRLAGGSAR